MYFFLNMLLGMLVAVLGLLLRHRNRHMTYVGWVGLLLLVTVFSLGGSDMIRFFLGGSHAGYLSYLAILLFALPGMVVVVAVWKLYLGKRMAP